MVFMTASVIAYHCGEIQKNLGIATAAVGVATASLELSKNLLKVALISGNPWAIAGAAASCRGFRCWARSRSRARGTLHAETHGL